MPDTSPSARLKDLADLADQVQASSAVLANVLQQVEQQQLDVLRNGLSLAQVLLEAMGEMESRTGRLAAILDVVLERLSRAEPEFGRSSDSGLPSPHILSQLFSQQPSRHPSQLPAQPVGDRQPSGFQAAGLSEPQIARMFARVVSDGVRRL